MKKTILSLFIVLAMALAGCKTTKETIWIGHPFISDNDPYTPSSGWLPGIIIGLKEDGTVVWKDANVEEKRGQGLILLPPKLLLLN